MIPDRFGGGRCPVDRRVIALLTVSHCVIDLCQAVVPALLPFFIEQHHLMPGESIEVEARDEVADSVQLKGRQDQRITIGMRAASKVRVSTSEINSRG